MVPWKVITFLGLPHYLGMGMECNILIPVFGIAGNLELDSCHIPMQVFGKGGNVILNLLKFQKYPQITTKKIINLRISSIFKKKKKKKEKHIHQPFELAAI